MGRGKRVGNGANAATVVLIPPDTLRKPADQLYTVLMTLSLTTRRARGLLGEILSPGRAKSGELQGTVERLEDLMRRYRQRRDARNGLASTRWQRLSEWRRWRPFFSKNLSEPLPPPTVTVGHVPESRSLRGSKRTRCTQAGSNRQGSRGQR